MISRVFRFRRLQLTRRTWVPAGGLIAALLLLWFIPAILSSRWLWPHVLSHLTSDLDARVRADDATLSWFSPVVLRHVSVDEPEGKQVVRVETLSTEKSLWSLLSSGGHYGVVRIEGAHLSLRMHARGSNLEDVFAPLLSRASESEGSRGRIEISTGRLDLFDQENTLIARMDSIEAIVMPSGDPSQPSVDAKDTSPGGTVDLRSCRITTDRGTGSLSGSLAWKRQANSMEWSLAANVESLDLSLLPPLARRWGVSVDMRGALDLKAEATWESASSRWTVVLEQADARSLQLAAPDWLGQDRLTFDRFQARGTYAFAHDTWRVTDAEIECDAGRVDLDGQFSWPSVSPGNTWNQLLATAATADLHVAGRADLARLAASLPHTLRIRENSVIESGALTFELAGESQGAERRWTAHVKTSALAARRGGERITWDDPLQVALAAQWTGEQWRIERFACTSSALTAVLNGTPAAGSFDLHCDVQQLASQLREFIELGSLKAAGNLTAQVTWQGGDRDRVDIRGAGLVEDFDLSAGEANRWREPRLSVTLAVQGRQGGQQATRLDSASLQLRSAADRLDLQLLEPVESPGADSVWTVGCSMQGQWSSWLSRVRPALSQAPALLDGTSTVEGPLDLQLIARLAPGSWEFDQVTLRSEPLHISTGQLSIREQVVAIEGKGRWDPGTRRLSIPDGTLQSEAVALRLTDFRMDPADNQSRITGGIAFRADLEKLHSHWRNPGRQEDWRVGGSAQGSLSLVQLGSATQARWTVDLVSVELARRVAAATAIASARNIIPATHISPWKTIWREPILKLSGSGQYDFHSRTVAFDRLDLASDDRLSLSIRGQLVEPAGVCTVDVQGQVTYDLAKLLQQVAPQWTSEVKLRGQDTQQFELRGPLFHPADNATGTSAQRDPRPAARDRGLVPDGLSGRAGLRWQSAELLGVVLGPASVQAELAAGSIDLGVVEMPLSGGMLRMQPTVHLHQTSPVVAIPPGQVLTDVRITPEMCDGWLKYVAPMVVQTTRAQGQFSLALQQATIPIGSPAAANVLGTVSLNSAQIAAGPLTQQLLQTVSYLGTLLPLKIPSSNALAEDPWVRLPPQSTRLQVVDGRVHHELLTFESGNVVIRTRGSVGFDQSLALVAAVPLQDQWLAGDRRLEVLRGITLEIPIGGTLDNPRLDRRALERLATDALRKATGQALQEELNRGLNKLLGPASR